MIKVLQVFDKMDRGGAETFIMNIYRNIKDVNFDFVTYTKEKGDYDDDIKSLGGTIYHLPRFNVINYFKFKREWNNFFKNHPEYRIIHGHAQGTAAIYLKIAHKYNLYTISHSHNTCFGKGLKGLIKKIFQKSIGKYADMKFACGTEAGLKLYKNNDFKVIYNSIDLDALEKYEDKSLLKEKYGFGNNFVIGHVGRFVLEKNHEFMIKLFNEFLKKKPNSLLVLIGRGEKEEEIRNLVKSYGIQDKVKFMGVRSDIPSLLKSMDIFIFPSLFEGFPLSLIEAQATKIKCLVSSNVTKDTMISNNIEFLDLDIDLWLDNMYIEDKEVIFNETKEIFRISKTCDYLSKFYKEVYNDYNSSNTNL